MKKILFINPVNKINVMKKSKALALPPYSFLVLASLTPDDVEVQIMDEAYEDINFDAKADLVGITCLTYTANRAYEISTEFRKRGIKTILGGVHPSMMPDEASRYADTVVIGEADDIWPEIVRDFLSSFKVSLKRGLKTFKRSRNSFPAYLNLWCSLFFS
jgi:radical SAM superfamily enzyme YgiQ (UPF0313 family)